MKTQSISIDKILEPGHQVRKVIAAEGLEDLTESINRVGMIEPIVVKPRGDKFEVIAGHRRYLAAQKSNLTRIPCIIRKKEDTNDIDLKLNENFFREDINPIDEAEFYAEVLNKKEISAEELGRKLGKSGAYVRTRLDLLRGDAQIAEAIRGGQINPSVGKELNLISDDSTRQYYLKYAVDSGAKLSTVRAWRLSYEKEARTQEAMDQGTPKESLPEKLPEYYYRCPVCQKSVELSKIRAISMCPDCYAFMTAQIQAGAKEHD